MKQAVNTVTHVARFGETYERLTSDYRIGIQATNGHDIYVTVRMQAIKKDRTLKWRDNR